MADDMRYLKPLASAAASRISSFKGYLAQKDFRPSSPRARPNGELDAGGSSPRSSWSQWAGDKLKRRIQSQEPNGYTTESLSLFPGWAARRFHKPVANGEHGYFDVEVFVSGFAARFNNPDYVSRSQRAFLRLAKGFANLPKLKDNPLSNGVNEDHTLDDSPLNQSMEDLLDTLPQRPSATDEAPETQDLYERRFQRSNYQYDSPLSSPNAHSQQSTPTSASTSPKPLSRAMQELQELHTNLEVRLQPFWSTALLNRTVRISLYSSEDVLSVVTAISTDPEEYEDPGLRPLAVREVTTTQGGSFQVKLSIPWDSLCTHPTGAQIAFGNIETEHKLFIRAELLPPPRSTSQAGNNRSSHVPNLPTPSTAIPVSGANITIPLTFAPIRVISDIDDTVKLANLAHGTRAVFTTAFAKKLSDVIIPGMGEWYIDMWRRGVRFHYVSNSPYELLPVIHEFFNLVNLPHGSIKLRSYGGRSLFSELLSAPMTRKRQGIVDLLETFSGSQFILIGDSGEQDLELYSYFSAEHPEQIIAVFIRDVRGTVGGEDARPLEDPTGSGAFARRTSNYSSRPPPSMRRTNSDNLPRNIPISASRTSSTSKLPRFEDYFTSRTALAPSKNKPWTTSQMTEEPNAYTPGGSRSGGVFQTITEADWKRSELQMRVDGARIRIPEHIIFRVFRHPDECVEVDQILAVGHGEDTRSGGSVDPKY